MPKSKTPRKQVSVTIDADLATWLEEEAERRMVSPAYLVSRALRFMRAEAFKSTEVVDVEIVDG